MTTPPPDSQLPMPYAVSTPLSQLASNVTNLKPNNSLYSHDGTLTASVMDFRKRAPEIASESVSHSSSLEVTKLASSSSCAPSTDSSFQRKNPNSRKRLRVSFCETSVADSKPPKSCQEEDPTMKHSVSCTALPLCVSEESETILISEASTGELDLTVSPSIFVKTIILQAKRLSGPLRGEDIISIANEKLQSDSYFVKLTEEQQQAYDTDKVNAVSSNDLDTLRSLLQLGQIMQTSNRFGESLLHTACRRGFTEIVDFFINEARVSPRVRDDMGRTPMHDACWSSAAPNHMVMKMLIRTAPELLLSKDMRGHSPFDYARREYWPNWVSFLNENRQFVLDSLVSSCLDGGNHFVHTGELSGREDGIRGTEQFNITQ